MSDTQLNYWEEALIRMIRNLSFLKDINYHEKEMSLGGRDCPTITFHNKEANRIVYVIGNEIINEIRDEIGKQEPSWEIVIQRKRKLYIRRESIVFNISNYYSTFESTMKSKRYYPLETQVEFIKNHLIPVLKGEKWIDELIKQKK